MTKHFILSSLALTMIMIAGCADNEKQNDTTNLKETQKIATDSSKPLKTILFFGNSLTAGYGLEPSEAFPALIQGKIDFAGLEYKTTNAGVSGETSAGGNGRIDWILKQPADVFVLELGANDGLRGIPITETRKNLQSIINKVKAKYPKTILVLAGMQIPPNMGQEYSAQFRNLFPDLAKKNNMALIPFLLRGVAGIRELNQQDGIHPTAAGDQIVAQNVWNVLETILTKENKIFGREIKK